MNYNFDFAVSANISAKVVEQMIKKVVEEQTGKTVDRIEIKMRSISKGVMRDEYTETVFEGATVFFKNENSTATVKPTGFKKDTY